MSDLRLFFFGDSITNGTGDETCLGWVTRLCAPRNVSGKDLSFYNLGVRRHSSKRIARRWRIEFEARTQPGSRYVALFMFGINDTGWAELEFDGFDDDVRVSHEDSLAIARAMVSEAGSEMEVLWLGPTNLIETGMDDNPPVAGLAPRNVRLAQLSKDYAAIADDLGIPYLSLIDHLHGHDQWIASLERGDGVHPTSAGYEILADLVSDWSPWRDLFDATHKD